MNGTSLTPAGPSRHVCSHQTLDRVAAVELVAADEYPKRVVVPVDRTVRSRAAVHHALLHHGDYLGQCRRDVAEKGFVTTGYQIVEGRSDVGLQNLVAKFAVGYQNLFPCRENVRHPTCVPGVQVLSMRGVHEHRRVRLLALPDDQVAVDHERVCP